MINNNFGDSLEEKLLERMVERTGLPKSTIMVSNA